MAAVSLRISKTFSDSSTKIIIENTSLNVLVGFDEPDDNCQALIVRSKDDVDYSLIQKFPNLKVIVSATSGFDHFDLDLVQKEKQIFFGFSPNANIVSCTELTLMHALNLLKNQKLHLEPKRTEKNLGLELFSKTVLIVGFGRIGQRVSTLLQSLGANVIAHDPYAFKIDFARLNVESVSLKEGLKKADVVSLHCPLTKKTKGMVDSAFFKNMKSDSFLINCARGELLIENDLIQALRNKDLKAAALDVFETEPLPETSDLWAEPRVYLSPHIGGYTQEAQIRSALESLKQVKGVLGDDNQGLCPLPLDAIWFKDLI